MSNHNYSRLDKVLHKIALGWKPIAELSFDLDQMLGGQVSPDISERPHVYIAGLARGGTTVLMRRFFASGAYRSLTYRDMPFVLMPRLWKKHTRRAKKDMEKTERAHGDGLMVDFDSPEALEEVFWRVFDGDHYIHADGLTAHQPDRAVLERYQKYVAAIVQSGDEHHRNYLAKNNNNILRLPAIREAFPNAIIIVPFRDPVQQANSLMQQHLRFSGEQDPFIRHYMTWLAHHEFGADQRPFRFPGYANPHNTDDLAYWVTLWQSVYAWLLENAPGNTVFCCYETLCTPDSGVWESLAEMAGISGSGPTLEPLTLRQSKVEHDLDEAILAGAMQTYERLKTYSLTG